MLRWDSLFDLQSMFLIHLKMPVIDFISYVMSRIVSYYSSYDDMIFPWITVLNSSKIKKDKYNLHDFSKLIVNLEINYKSNEVTLVEV